MRNYLSCTLAILAALLWGTHAASADETPGSRIDFNRDIRPILSNSCFTCHGPDEDERQAGLRLDTAEGALAEPDSGVPAIVPGRPDQSELVRRVASDDADERMPPDDSGKTLTADEKERLAEWIRDGAHYARHWSYVIPERPPLPDATAAPAPWPRNGVDHFILNRQRKEKLTPSPEADRYTLVRRVSLDLTGLPPAWEEVEQFVNDASPQAYENLVDRLLEKKTYGEHWARMWLDLARYADSAGYADDPPRTIWAFRDYVIRSLNANKPFDQFTIEQVAGDLLPDPSEEQLAATAFHRNTLTNNEGGTNDEEFRNVAIVDRVNTTMAVWMGTTIACAQCHNHKYDPISQEEFFRLFAILNNSADADRRDESPRLEIWSDEQQQQKATWQSEIAALEKTVRAATPELLSAQARWEQRFATEPTWQALRPAEVKSQSNPQPAVMDDSSVLVSQSRGSDVYTVVADAAAAATALTAIRIETLPDDSLPGKGPGHAGGNFVVTRVLAKVVPPAGSDSNAGDSKADSPVKFVATYADFSQNGFAAANALDAKNPTNQGWAIAPQFGRPHWLTLIPQSPIEIPLGAKLHVTIEQLSKHADHTLGRFRLAVSRDADVADYVQTPASILAVLKTPAEKRTTAQQAELTRHYLGIAPELKTQRDRLAGLQKQLAAMKPYTTVPVMRELAEGQRRKTRIQRRGNFLDTGDEVSPGLPSAFHAPAGDDPPNRLVLARWLVDERNPLTARVVANRFWEAIFGRGIVVTSEEFGSQGELPTHPALLDWLATELVRLEWDTKAFLKLLVTSAAYRQSSRVTPELLERDPDNILLARGPRFRLSAEMIRDQALAVSGLLSVKMYGPPAKPPQPAMGLSAAFGSGIDWKTSQGEDRYRRGLYTTWRRSNPYPSMATFDAPNREVCTLRRARTNTPLQALVTLNDPVYIEAAQALARRMTNDGMTADGETPADIARTGFQLCVARPPQDEELKQLVRLYEQTRARFAEAPDNARRMATVPLGPAPQGADVVELAAWTVVGNVLLNLDEMFMKR